MAKSGSSRTKLGTPKDTRAARGAKTFMENVLARPSSFSALYVSEPQLVFARGMTCPDPRTGLTYFGPYDRGTSARSPLRVSVIGTSDCKEEVRAFLQRTGDRIAPGLNKRNGRPYDFTLHPDFPGFSLESSFGCELTLVDHSATTLKDRELDPALSKGTSGQKVVAVVDLICNALHVLEGLDPKPDVVIVAMPQKAQVAFGTGTLAGRRKPFLSKSLRFQRRFEAAAKRTKQKLLMFGDSTVEVEDDDDSTSDHDFHNLLKARAMQFHLPTQLVWEGTLGGVTRNEDPATLAWNFMTALYYKAGNVPWKLHFSSPNTCFVGITFHRASSDPRSPTRASLAQAFSQTGEGLVLKGEPAEWDPAERQAHLSRDSAERLLKRVLDEYEAHNQHAPPTRVVIHKTSKFSAEERVGFGAALKNIHSYDFLALLDRGIRFLRMGYHPPLRGTCVVMGKRDYLVYTQGYAPFLGNYPGHRIPVPIEIAEHFGDSAAEVVCGEVLSLTKLNWNNCRFSGSDPITIAFARRVGNILREVGEGEPREHRYRFYM